MKSLYDVAYILRKTPQLKYYLKNVYQYIGNLFSKKGVETQYKFYQISDDAKEHLFGYYDKSPWNIKEDKLIYLEVENSDKEVAPLKIAKIIIHDLTTNEKKEIAHTNAWNIQQGCMLQWLGESEDEIIYNDYFNNHYVSIVLNIKSCEKRIIDMPIYSLSSDGKIALSLDFSRLHRLRPGYGYANLEDKTKNELLPNSYCIWKIDINNEEITGLLTYKEVYDFHHDDSMNNAEHKINHIMINPSANRFMFLHRWIKNGVKKTRLLTADIDGKNLYEILNDDMVSHCNWKNDNEILAWARKEEYGNHYYLLKDKTREFSIIAENELNTDGHPSYSQNGKYFVTDTYPNFKRMQHVYLYNIENKTVYDLLSIYSNIKYINDCRCDLHPRWNRNGNKICIDASPGKLRQIYILDLEDFL